MKTVYQTDRAGLLIGSTTADESPLEPGVFHIPAGATEIAPPESFPAGQWPRFNGVAWSLVNVTPAKPEAVDPVAKLRAFLNSNPDVAAILNQ
ncbi:phage tail protein [Paraburkholderia sp. BR10936]|uniref:phage tail protein n=1 Tax=Paraburkholderia sp. BR10936 TaxID=3236993 RepID=UPI0034D38D31